MSKADVVVATLEAKVDCPYVFGAQGPNSFDCSGLHWYAYHKAGIPWARTTADGFKRQARPLTPSEGYKVGDPIFFLGKSGTAYHVATFTGYRDGVGYSIEARSRRYGVVEYRLDDPVHGVLKRKGRFYRYPGINLGEITEEDVLTPDEHQWLKEVRQWVAPKQSYCSAITNALLIGDREKAAALNDTFWKQWPEGDSGLPKGWKP